MVVLGVELYAVYYLMSGLMLYSESVGLLARCTERGRTREARWSLSRRFFWVLVTAPAETRRSLLSSLSLLSFSSL